MTDCINSTIFLSQVRLAKMKNTLLVVICALSNLVAIEASCLQPVILDGVCYLYFPELSFPMLFGGHCKLPNAHTNATLPRHLELYFHLV